MARTEAGLAVERAFPAGMASVRFEIEGVLSLISEAGAKTAGLHHLVLHSLQRTAGKAAWVAFNDYCIAETPGETALDFTQPWRTPVCLVYRNCSVPDETPGETPEETVGETVGETVEETVGAENAREPRDGKRGEPKDLNDAEKKKEEEKEEEENAESVAQSKENAETPSTSTSQSTSQSISQSIAQSTIQPTSQSTSTSTTQSATPSLPSVPRSLPISLPPPLPSLPSSSSSSSSQPFYTPISLQSASPAYRRLSPAELPGAGDLVAIDCEFVALNCEEVPPFPLFSPNRRKFCPTAIES